MAIMNANSTCPTLAGSMVMVEFMKSRWSYRVTEGPLILSWFYIAMHCCSIKCTALSLFTMYSQIVPWFPRQCLLIMTESFYSCYQSTSKCRLPGNEALFKFLFKEQVITSQKWAGSSATATLCQSIMMVKVMIRIIMMADMVMLTMMMTKIVTMVMMMGMKGGSVTPEVG